MLMCSMVPEQDKNKHATVQHKREATKKQAAGGDAQQHVDVDWWGSSFYGNDYLP